MRIGHAFPCEEVSDVEGCWIVEQLPVTTAICAGINATVMGIREYLYARSFLPCDSRKHSLRINLIHQQRANGYVGVRSWYVSNLCPSGCAVMRHPNMCCAVATVRDRTTISTARRDAAIRDISIAWGST